MVVATRRDDGVKTLKETGVNFIFGKAFAGVV